MGNAITRLIMLNVGLFALYHLVRFVLFFAIPDDENLNGVMLKVLESLAISSNPETVLERPWTIFSNIFFHQGVFHLLFNMIFIWWFGRMVADLIGDSKIVPLYLLTGIFGAALAITIVNVSPRFADSQGFSVLYGASGSAMGLMLCALRLAPNRNLFFPFLGAVPLKYLVWFFLALDLLAIPRGENVGGHVAHLGGAFFGYFLILLMQKGWDLTVPINNFFNWILAWFRPRQRVKVAHKSKAKKRFRKAPSQENQDRANAILQKMREFGYDGLTEEEKEFLFKKNW